MDRELRHALAEILGVVRAIRQKQDVLMSVEQDLQTALDLIQSRLAAFIASIGAITPDTVTQPQLDALVAEAQAIAASIPSVPPPATVAAGTAGAVPSTDTTAADGSASIRQAT